MGIWRLILIVLLSFIAFAGWQSKKGKNRRMK